MNLGTFDCQTVCQCGCGCGTQPFVVYDETRMRCNNCSCVAARQDVRIMIRLYITGVLTVAAMEKALETSRLLGAADDAPIKQDGNNMQHFIEVPAEGIHTKWEIARLKGT